jgi:hypothetical protein
VIATRLSIESDDASDQNRCGDGEQLDEGVAHPLVSAEKSEENVD